MNCQKNISKSGEKIRNSVKKEFDSQLVYNEIYLKTKIEFYKRYQHFCNDKLSKEVS